MLPQVNNVFGAQVDLFALRHGVGLVSGSLVAALALRPLQTPGRGSSPPVARWCAAEFLFCVHA